MSLAIRHITEYYDMKLATFGLDSDGSLVVAFPVFVKGHASKPKTLKLKWFAMTHPDYALAIRHITEYYDMKLATFGLDSDGSLVVAFPVFVKGHASKPKTLKLKWFARLTLIMP